MAFTPCVGFGIYFSTRIFNQLIQRRTLTQTNNVFKLNFNRVFIHNQSFLHRLGINPEAQS